MSLPESGKRSGDVFFLWLLMLALTTAAAEVAAQSTQDLPAEATAEASGAPTDGARRRPDRRLWEIGASALWVDQQAFPGSSARVRRGLFVPYFVYRGPILRAEGGGLGLRAIKNPRYELDIGGAGAFGSGSNVPLREGMPEIGTLGEVGPRLKIRLGDLQGPKRWSLDLPLRFVFNLSRQFEYTGIAFEPRLSYRRRLSTHFSVFTSASLLFGDKRLANNFYGVPAQFVTATRPAYDARAGYGASRLSASLTYRINRAWRITGFARLDSVAGSTNRDSPLIDRETGYTYGIRIGWTIAESDEPGAN